MKFVQTLSVVDIFLLVGLFIFVYALVGVAHEWAGPYRPKTEIDLGLSSLFLYSFLSLIRVFAAYVLSLAFTLTYGYWAAKSKKAEPFLISLLDILQSVPVLGFMPGVVLALVSLFPNSNFGLELAAVLMIFTGEGWNMVFSFYSSLKAVPQELRELASLCRMRKLHVLRNIEIPYGMNGLLWNSMLSMAGGWFFLMVIESFSLGDRDFRLAGIGSYMAVAYERSDVGAILAGILSMFTLIVLVDRCLWAPMVVWSERFRFDRDGHGPLPKSVVLEWLKRSNLLAEYFHIMSRLTASFEKKIAGRKKSLLPAKKKGNFRPIWMVLRGCAIAIGFLAVIYGLRSMGELFARTNWLTWFYHFRDTFFTLLRVAAAVILGSLWAIPLGVFIGTHPQWTRRFQPVVQVVASFPAPMLFPIITFLLIQCGVSLEFGAVVLMLFASQWYILFNVISGATLIPQQMIDVADIFHVKGLEYWKAIILPAIFPSLVNGWISAAGGAWNACIVAEFVPFGDSLLTATGIGASISGAAHEGDFPRLAGSIITMVLTVVLLNRFLWGSLYRLAETRFRLES